MIARVGDHPGVVGLEILNEPGSGTAGDVAGWKHETLNPFHTEAVAQLRALAGDELPHPLQQPGDRRGRLSADRARAARGLGARVRRAHVRPRARQGFAGGRADAGAVPR